MTFRVILRKDVIYKNNTSPLCLLFFHDNRRKSVGLGVSVAFKYWDAEAQKVTEDCPDRDDIQFQITAKIKEYEKKIKKLEALEIPVTFEDCKGRQCTLFECHHHPTDCCFGATDARTESYQHRDSESCKTSNGMAEMIFATFSVIENSESANKNI